MTESTLAKLFGTNGIRGKFGEDFTLDFVSDVCLSLASFFNKGPILVGYDGRESSPIIAKIVCSSINSVGIDCHVTGLVPTPCLEYATKNLGYAGGIMITASHNPSEYNGIKPVFHDGVEISRKDELVVEDIFFKKNWISNNKFGHTKKEERAIETYINDIVSKVDPEKIRSQKFKVVLDLGNGAQAVTAPKLCQKLGCEIVTLNEEIDGTFPGRGPEPLPENLQDLSDKVMESKADFGVAFDGDGDRTLFCDNNGNILSGDKSALLLSKYILEKNPKSKIVTSLNSASTIEKIAEKNSSTVIRTKVGSVEVSREMVLTNAIIGFEENGGFMYGLHNYVRDGAMTTALMLDLLANSTLNLSDEVATLPKTFTKKDKVQCTKEESSKIIDTLKKTNYRVDETDGVKIIFNESNWVMVRQSGTEPIIRIYAESDSQEKLDDLLTEYKEKIKSILCR